MSNCMVLSLWNWKWNLLCELLRKIARNFHSHKSIQTKKQRLKAIPFSSYSLSIPSLLLEIPSLLLEIDPHFENQSGKLKLWRPWMRRMPPAMAPDVFTYRTSRLRSRMSIAPAFIGSEIDLTSTTTYSHGSWLPCLPCTFSFSLLQEGGTIASVALAEVIQKSLLSDWIISHRSGGNWGSLSISSNAPRNPPLKKRGREED